MPCAQWWAIVETDIDSDKKFVMYYNLATGKTQPSPPTLGDEAAVVIQRVSRGHLARVQFSRLRDMEEQKT